MSPKSENLKSTSSQSNSASGCVSRSRLIPMVLPVIVPRRTNQVAGAVCRLGVRVCHVIFSDSFHGFLSFRSAQ